MSCQDSRAAPRAKVCPQSPSPALLSSLFNLSSASMIELQAARRLFKKTSPSSKVLGLEKINSQPQT